MPLHFPKGQLPVALALAALPAWCCTCSAQQPSPSPRQVQDAFREGVAAFSRNDLTTARAEFETVVRLAPSIQQGHSALGAVLVKLGETGAGIRELEKALAMRADDTSALQNLAMAWEQIGQPAKALPWFARLDGMLRAQNHPLPAEVLAAWARALAATRQYSAATAKMKRAIAAAPKNPEFIDEMGSIYAQQEDWPDAQQAFLSALQMNPGLAKAHLHLGLALEEEQQQGASQELLAAYQLAPENSEIALAVGQHLAASGDDQEAIPVLKHALELDPSSIAASYQLGLALQRTNQVNDAIPLLEKAAAADAGNAAILVNLGMALCQVDRAKDGIPVLERAVSLEPDNATAHENLAAAYIQLSRLDDAIVQLRTALRVAPQQPQLHYNLGLALKMKDDEADAIPEFETAEKLDPSAPEPPFALGMLYLQAGRYSDAERELNATLKLQPANGDGWATLGSVYNHLDKLPEAATALQEAIRQRPDQPDSYLLLATVLVKQNQLAQAAEERKKAADLMRANMNHQRAEVASNSGNDQLNKGNVNDAIVEFRDAISYDPAYAQAHVGLAKALQQQGRVAEAAAERQQAKALEEKSAQQDQR